MFEFVKTLLTRPNDDKRHDLVSKIFNGNGLAILNKHLKGFNFFNKLYLINYLGICVEANHMKKKHIILVNGVSDTGADKLMFKFNDIEISVAQYFSKVYNITLRYPKIPCVIESKATKSGTHIKAYYPIELLTISEGQRVSFDKQTPKLV